jgi:hypothetical protein
MLVRQPARAAPVTLGAALRNVRIRQRVPDSRATEERAARPNRPRETP